MQKKQPDKFIGYTIVEVYLRSESLDPFRTDQLIASLPDFDAMLFDLDVDEENYERVARIKEMVEREIVRRALIR